MKTKDVLNLVSAMAAVGLFALHVQPASSVDLRAVDPGLRNDKPDAGELLPGLSDGQKAFFEIGKEDFSAVEKVDEGLGPRMNLDSCAGCHMQPAVGGSSPSKNPQFGFAGRYDKVPSFITENGPVREVRYVRNHDGTPDGGVHALYTITGREGATDCKLAQPDFETEMANHNVIFRIPTPVFGAGLIEQIPDSAILANRANDVARKATLGIRGRANFHVAGRAVSGQNNRNGNDGTIARFGWKAQNKSLLLFAGEAYNVEMGITNELFQNERDETSTCQYALVPNDVTNTEATRPLDAISGIEKFAFFMRFLDAPRPSADKPGGAVSIANGKKLFADVGCALCHTPSLTTGNSQVAALRYQPVNLYSDLLVHDMGTGLADGISQGEAGPREFRSAPLWGLGQRLFFLHDGRTSDLSVAIREHASPGSEANGVVFAYRRLREPQKQDLLNFLRSL